MPSRRSTTSSRRRCNTISCSTPSASSRRATLWLLRSGLTLDLRAPRRAVRPPASPCSARGSWKSCRNPRRRRCWRALPRYASAASPEALAARVPRLDYLVSSADIVRLAEAAQGDLIAVGRAYFAVGARFALDTLRAAAEQLQPGTNWQKNGYHRADRRFLPAPGRVDPQGTRRSHRQLRSAGRLAGASSRRDRRARRACSPRCAPRRRSISPC